MKLKLLSAVIAASLLAGCSSSGSSGGNSGGQVGAPTTPDLSDPDFDSGVIPTYANINELGGAVIITGDNGNNAIIRTDGEGNAAVAINDYNNMYVVKDGELFDNDGNQVGNISNDDGQYTVSLDNGLEVVLRDEDGRLFAAIISKPNPDQPIIHDPDYDGGITPTYGNITELGGAVIVTGDNGNNAIIRTDGEGNAAIAINDYDNMYVVKDGELFDNDGNQVGNISNDDGQYTVSLDNGLEVVLRDEDGRLFAAIISKPNPDQPIIHDPDYDSGIIPTYGTITELGGAVIITGDNGNNAIIRTDGEGNAAIAINDYDNMYVVKDGELFDNDGNQVGNISNDDGQYTVSLNNGLEVVLRDEDGRLFAAIISRPNPDQPIIHDPDYDSGIIPTYGNITELGGAVLITGDNGNNAIIRTDGEGNAAIAINDYDNMYVVKDGELFDNDGNKVGNISNDDGHYTISLDSGLEVVFRNDNGRLFAAIVARPDMSSPIRDKVIDHANVGEKFNITINNRGMIYIDNGHVAGDSGFRLIEKTDGHYIVNPQGEVVGQYASKELNYGLQYTLVKTEHGITIVQSRKGSAGISQVEGAKTITQDGIDEVKSRIQSLSQEQRQQIKHAVKDRVGRS